MIVLLRSDAAPPTIAAVRDAIRSLGLEAVPLDDMKGRAFEVLGGDPSRVLGLRGMDGVAEILTRRRALRGGEPVWPHFALRLTVVMLMLGALLSLLAAFFPPGLGDRATGEAADLAVVEWYLRPFAGFFSLVRGHIGGWAMLVLWILFFVWPFLEKSDAGTGAGSRASRITRMFGLLVALAFLVFGIWGPRG